MNDIAFSKQRMLLLIAILTLKVFSSGRVTLDKNALDRDNIESFKISTPTATYFIQKKSGGMATILDKNGKDWVGHKRVPKDGRGEYRGFPNTGVFHPGRFGGQEYRNVQDKDNYVSIEFTYKTNNLVRYEFYPEVSVFTFINVNKQPYWFLFEGTPFETTKADDIYWVSKDKTKNYTEKNLNDDLEDPEWLAFGTRECPRVFLMVNHENDNTSDRFTRWDGQMIIASFGRKKSTPTLMGNNRKFLFGFVETNTPEEIAEVAESWRSMKPTDIEKKYNAAPVIQKGYSCRGSFYNLKGQHFLLTVSNNRHPFIIMRQTRTEIQRIPIEF